MKNASRQISAPTAAINEPLIAEILDLTDEVTNHIRKGCHGALRIGLRLLALHRLTGDTEAPGGFRGALDAMAGKSISRATAYRWMNATAAVLGRHQKITDPADLKIPTTPGKIDWSTAEKILNSAADGMSLNRLALGASATSDESRLDTLITQSEQGDPNAEAALDAVYAGRMTLVQAIRAAAGAAATKSKSRQDPVYLDIDGATGQPKGLFPRCLVTLSNTFRQWETLDEAARIAARKAWKELVSHLPSDLR